MHFFFLRKERERNLTKFSKAAGEAQFSHSNHIGFKSGSDGLQFLKQLESPGKIYSTKFEQNKTVVSLSDLNLKLFLAKDVITSNRNNSIDNNKWKPFGESALNKTNKRKSDEFITEGIHIDLKQNH